MDSIFFRSISVFLPITIHCSSSPCSIRRHPNAFTIKLFQPREEEDKQPQGKTPLGFVERNGKYFRLPSNAYVTRISTLFVYSVPLWLICRLPYQCNNSTGPKTGRNSDDIVELGKYSVTELPLRERIPNNGSNNRLLSLLFLCYVYR